MDEKMTDKDATLVTQAFGLSFVTSEKCHCGLTFTNKSSMTLYKTRQGTTTLGKINNPQLLLRNPQITNIIGRFFQYLHQLGHVILSKFWHWSRKFHAALIVHTLTSLEKTDAVNLMLNIIDKYSTDVEDVVQMRTRELTEDKERMESLLTELFPRPVAASLVRSRHTDAVMYDDVTIFFSDIVGFTVMSASSTPLQVVELLNDLYTKFDSLIAQYDVYKVETIGDAYMVASGVPTRNGRRHAGEICCMALSLIKECNGFTIKHLPGVPLKIRVGIHTGACAAGIVGVRMPRYCLYGDTVNTASRMETSGAANLVHISQQTKDALDEFNAGHQTVLRGEIELKGKGKQTTYWLVGMEGSSIGSQDH